MKHFIAYFQKNFSDYIFDAAETEFYCEVYLNEQVEITMKHMAEIIALCGDTFTFSVSASAHCEDDTYGMMRYDSHYEGQVVVTIKPN